MHKGSLFKKPKGFSETAILYTVVLIGLALAGGLFVRFRNYPIPGLTVPNGGLICCDKGNDAACQPYTDPQHPPLQWKGQTYEIMTSGIMASYCHRHRVDTGLKTPAGFPPNTNPGGDPVILDNSDELNQKPGECGTGGQDQLMCNVNGNKTCIPIPNDEFIYVCKKNCFTTPPDKCCDQDAQGFGNPNTIYDAYYRVSDLPKYGVPDPIKSCYKCGDINNDYHCGTPPNGVPGGINPGGNPQIVLSPSPYIEHKSLQLHTFGFTQNAHGLPGPPWRSFCKPAVYLYTPQKEEVHVQVEPKGQMLATTPEYPGNGWDVIANPNGEIEYNNASYDYLYYEARIADNLLEDQRTGYSVAYNDLSDLLNTLLPKLGLNQKEKQQFEAYWLTVLPKSPYYFVSVVPQSTIEAIAPLMISPQPNTVIRVALNFQPLDKKIQVDPPVLPSVVRSGFTVLEWGGLFKQDPDHPFTCFM